MTGPRMPEGMPMPEGDTIARWAGRVREALVGKPLTRVELGVGGRAMRGRPPPRRPVSRLVGETVHRVEPYGKHLLVGTESRWIRVHVGLRGKWRVVADPQAAWGFEVGVVLAVADATAVALRPTEVEVVRYVEDLRRIPRIAGLGPDLMDEVDLDAVVARARVVRDTERTLAACLTDQVVAAGLGNVYKSETCFLAGLHPLTPLDALSDEVLGDTFALGARLLRANRDRPVRRTTGDRAGGAGPDLWVYERAGRPCLVCRAPVRVTRHTDAGRPVWWCPGCQPG